jgi:hypothetical protein
MKRSTTQKTAAKKAAKTAAVKKTSTAPSAYSSP